MPNFKITKALIGILMLLQAWSLGGHFISSLFIDFFAVPGVFKTLTSSSLVRNGILIGGEIGLGLYTHFNYFELILALVFVIPLFFRPVHYKLSLMSLGLILVGIVLTYIFVLTPGIQNAFDLLSTPSLPEKLRLYGQEKRALFHHIYIALDALKMIILLCSFIFLLFDIDFFLKTQMKILKEKGE